MQRSSRLLATSVAALAMLVPATALTQQPSDGGAKPGGPESTR